MGTAVHPRVCGEHISFQANRLWPAGSSPRVRGTQEAALQAEFPGRFIPACAGNTYYYDFYGCKGPVHPRVCGEHVAQDALPPCVLGSSPRVRGTLNRIKPLAVPHRFIPACAGNTVAKSRITFLDTVHPRVCGEHPRYYRQAPLQAGSSPRVRGTRVTDIKTAVDGRFIPACAGNTIIIKSIIERKSVHPRVCGEHKLLLFDMVAMAGSSPRVRGTPVGRFIDAVPRRFIPACAGNTH